MIASDVRLVDHHCHGLLFGALPAAEFRLLATESDWLSIDGIETLDSPFGLGIRSRCAPLLDLPRHASIADYLARRDELGAPEVNRRLMAATGTDVLILDTGFTASDVVSPSSMTGELGIGSAEIVRLERIAEEVAPSTTASGFLADFREALQRASAGAVGFKSVMAYRTGFDIPDSPFTAAEVEAAAAEWLAGSDPEAGYRLDHRVLLAHVVWEAVALAKPIQFHVGFGDSDVHLHLSDPTRLTGFFRATRASGASMMLLHCYPFIREAGSLAHIFPHVYLDVGLVSHYMGPSAGSAVRESLEIAPFHKVLYSSDAYGLAEHYLVSATSWRSAISRIAEEWLVDDWLTAGEADRIVEAVAAGNARRVYGLGNHGLNDRVLEVRGLDGRR
ncbi:amidohydrolase family protein [Cryobacterium tagatosivorans]|uniref:Amidohydrolase n=1 Tax=Cryobacterium tagatosivorans TaxID=1259199 RepID=A0A4R8UF72_9MICO|nr:amidohydrolase family protein [Cryobacterium tagatosivorans]TFB52435.1 amidohydrolase [Cryobacterium tagatosivorans]